MYLSYVYYVIDYYAWDWGFVCDCVVHIVVCGICVIVVVGVSGGFDG